MNLRWVALLLLVVLAALVALQGSNEPGPTDAVERSDAEHVAPPLVGEKAAQDASADPGPTLTGEGSEESSRHPDAATTTGGDSVAPRRPDTKVAATYAGEVPAGWHDAPPAQRPHAIRPPRPRGPSMRPGGSSGGVGPTGHWSRFPPPGPPKGDATLHVVVTDQTGARVSAADVYLGPRESLCDGAVSFGDLRKLGATDVRGELLVPELPAGAGILAANVANQLNGPRGLDAGSSIPVLLVSRATVSARVTLPLDTGAFGAIAGQVVDADKRPVARAEIRCGFFRTYADADGRFAAPNLPAGEQTLLARRSGYGPESVTVDVPRGGTRSVEILLDWAERGPLRLEGRVLTADGTGLEGATLYLIDETGRGTLRTVRSRAEGHYVFEDLPDRLQTTALRLQAGSHREGYPATNVRLEEGLADTRLDVRLPPRQVKVRFLLTDAGGGEPVDRCRVEVERLDDPEAAARGFTGRRPDGVFEHWFPAGRYRFEVLAPDREPRVVEADLAPPGATVDLAVAFPSVGEPSVPVTVRLRVLDRVTNEPVTDCAILLLDAEGEEAARFVGRDPEGRYSLPAPSGAWTLRVSAEGYEAADEPVELDPPESEFVTYLAPR